MKKLAVLFSIVPLLFLFTVASPAQADVINWTGNVNIFLGGKFLDEDDWPLGKNQFEYGIEIDFKKRSWPVSIALDYLRGNGVENFIVPDGLESNTSEIAFGVRKIVDHLGPIKPFVGGGVTIVSGELLILGIGESDTGVGFWVSGGLYMRILRHLNLGLEARYSSAEVNLFGADLAAGGIHIGALLGAHF